MKKIQELKNIELNVNIELSIYDERYMKTKIITYPDKVYTNFHSLNVSEYYIECESFTAISIDSLLLYNCKYLENCGYKVVNKQMTYFLDEKD